MGTLFLLFAGNLSNDLRGVAFKCLNVLGRLSIILVTRYSQIMPLLICLRLLLNSLLVNLGLDPSGKAGLFVSDHRADWNENTVVCRLSRLPNWLWIFVDRI
jgi:hypothetical protein